MLIDKNNSEHYFWGDNCEGWRVVKSDALSVIEEEMPPHAKEKMHYHEKALQVFHIKEGIAKFEINGEVFIAQANQSVVIHPGLVHRIINHADTRLKFLVISQPSTAGDRIEI